MYQPAAFRQEDPALLRELIAEHPLATLIHTDASGHLQADLIPMLWSPQGAGPLGSLIGHVARANPMWQDANGREVLAVFHGPQAYVSPSWYPSKASQGGKVVPTWNHVQVQARGVLTTTQDPAELLAVVQALTEFQETGRADPWAVGDAPPDYIATMLRAIVGIRIDLSELLGKWKTSQNRPEDDRRGVLENLLSEPQDAALHMARLVAETLPPIS